MLAPGAYEFTINNDPSGKIVIVRSRESGWSGIILSAISSDMQFAEGTKLLLAKSDAGVYVRALCLGDSGVMLNYRMPEAGKMTRLEKPKPSVVASASGAH